MNSISIVFAALLVIVRSCPLYEDKYCCDGEEFVNDCFVRAAGKDSTLCQHHECNIGGLEDIVFNSSEWQNTIKYVSQLDSAINSKLLDSGIRLNYGCWDHYRLKKAKEQLVNGKNFYVKLQLLCDPLHYFAHVYFYLPINMDSEGHILFPHPELMGMQYPKLEFDPIERFEENDITVIRSTESPIESTQILVGNDEDEHGCIGSAGYEWCAGEHKCYRAWEETCTESPIESTQILVGDDEDEHGCIISAGYEWCEEENKCYRGWEETCGSLSTSIRPIGGDRDAHDCFISAGYIWCASKAKCYRVWEEDCPSIATTSSVVVDGDESDGSDTTGVLDEKFQRIGIVVLFVILGFGITLFCVARKKHVQNKSGNQNTQVNESSVSYENLL